MKEREISLTDLTVEILLHWRKIALAMLAGAVLAGAFSYVRSYYDVKALEAESQVLEGDAGKNQSESVRELEETMTKVQIQNVKDVLAYEQMYENRKVYREHSILMQMDPNQVCRIDLTFYIRSDKRQLSFDLEKVYEDLVLSGGMYTYAAQQTGLDPADMAEVISVSRGSDGLAEGTCTFKVTIKNADQAQCEDIAAAAETFLQKKHTELSQAMGSHQIRMIRQSPVTIADTDMMDCQKNNLQELLTMADSIAQRKAAFVEEQSRYYELLTDIRADSPATGKDLTAGRNTADARQVSSVSGEGSHAVPGISIKYVIFGTVLAAFAYAFILFLQYVLNGRLCASDRLPDLYGIPQLGVIPGQGGQKRMSGFVDQWLLSLRDHDRRRFTKEEALRLSVTAVRMAAVKEGTESICLAGCNLDKDTLEICEAVKEQLAKEDISCTVLDNVLYDEEAMCRLEEVKGAVLVARVRYALYSEISQELELLERQGIVVLGGIILQ